MKFRPHYSVFASQYFENERTAGRSLKCAQHVEQAVLRTTSAQRRLAKHHFYAIKHVDGIPTATLFGSLILQTLALFRQLLFNNAMMGLQYAVAALLPLLLIPHIVKTIGLERYGEIAVALSWMSYATIVVQYAFHLTGPKYVATLKPGESRSDVLVQIYAAKLILLACVFAACSGWLIFAADPRSAGRTALLFALPIGGVLHAGWYLQAVGRFTSLAIVSIFSSLTALALGFGLLSPATSSGPTIAVLILVSAPFLAGFGTFLLVTGALKESLWSFSWKASIARLRDGWTLFVSQFTAALYGASGTIVVAALAGPAEAGAYSTVERVANGILGACLLTHTVAYPKLAVLYGTSRNLYWRLLALVFALYFASVSVIVAVPYISGISIEQLLFGISTGEHSLLISWGVVWLFLGIFGSAVTGYLVVSGHQHRVWPLTMKILLFSLVLGVPGVLMYGAWAWLASLAVSQSIILFIAAQLLWKQSSLARDHGH